jgi:hypothetical protein
LQIGLLAEFSLRVYTVSLEISWNMDNGCGKKAPAHSAVLRHPKTIETTDRYIKMGSVSGQFSHFYIWCSSAHSRQLLSARLPTARIFVVCCISPSI